MEHIEIKEQRTNFKNLKPIKKFNKKNINLQIQDKNLEKSKFKKNKNSIFIIPENEWIIGAKDKSYTINTSGCGAIKIFVDMEKKKPFIIFHSFGTKDSENSAYEIANYITHYYKDAKSVHIFNVQPYAISSSISKSINIIKKNIEKDSKIPVIKKTLCLNGIGCEKFTKFISINLNGSEKEITQRYKHLTRKKNILSDIERNKKIGLYVSLPHKYKTREFINKWGTLSLDEAEKKHTELTTSQSPIFRFLKTLSFGYIK